MGLGLYFSPVFTLGIEVTFFVCVFSDKLRERKKNQSRERILYKQEKNGLYQSASRKDQNLKCFMVSSDQVNSELLMVTVCVDECMHIVL